MGFPEVLKKFFIISSIFLKDKEEAVSPGNETDSNSTNTTPKTMISYESSIKQGSPTPSLSSEVSTGPIERPNRFGRSVTPVPVNLLQIIIL